MIWWCLTVIAGSIASMLMAGLPMLWGTHTVTPPSTGFITNESTLTTPPSTWILKYP